MSVDRDEMHPVWDDPYAPDQWYEGADEDAWGYPVQSDDHYDTTAEYRGER